MSEPRLYTQDEVLKLATRAVMVLMNLDNGTMACAQTTSEGDDDMAKRIKKRVTVNGKERWITGATEQDCMDTYMDLCIRQGIVVPPIIQKSQNGSHIPLFKDYLPAFLEIFKNKQQSITKINRDRIVRNHIIPKFGDVRVDHISTGDLQKWFDELAVTYSHETILKIRNIMSPAFDAAVEDGYISRNPLKSSRIKIGGAQTVHHKAIPKEKMDYIRANLWNLQIRERNMASLLSYTGMRFEEVLGLRWQDIDFDRNTIHICRAVVHPSRNMPEVKATKTQASTRYIPLPVSLRRMLIPRPTTGFVIPSASDKTGQTPLSYSEARNMFKRLRVRFDIPGFTAHDFRDTCATEWRERGLPTDIIARLLGHTKTQVTQKRYVKYRDEIMEAAKSVMQGFSDTENHRDVT